MEERNLKVWDIVEYDKQLVVITEIDYGTGTTRTLSTLIRLNADLCGNAV